MVDLDEKKLGGPVLPHAKMIKVILQHLGYDVDDDKLHDAINNSMDEIRVLHGLDKGDISYRIMSIVKE